MSAPALVARIRQTQLKREIGCPASKIFFERFIEVDNQFAGRKFPSIVCSLKVIEIVSRAEMECSVHNVSVVQPDSAGSPIAVYGDGAIITNVPRKAGYFRCRFDHERFYLLPPHNL